MVIQLRNIAFCTPWNFVHLEPQLFTTLYSILKYLFQNIMQNIPLDFVLEFVSLFLHTQCLLRA